MSVFDKDDLTRRMQGALETLTKEFAGLRTGRVSVGLLEPLMVEAYGAQMPLTQVGTLGVSDARTLSVQVWDKAMVKTVEKAIRESSLGLNPTVDGQTVRIPMPELTAERRQELKKVVAKYTEQSRVAIRNVRRDGMEGLKRLEKEGDISEDEHRRLASEIQSLTDTFIAKVDDASAKKEKDILQV